MSIKIIQQLLNEMHKDIKELMEFERIETSAEKIKDKSIKLQKLQLHYKFRHQKWW